MAFNHYAKIKRILDNHVGDWHVRRVNQPTTAKSFKGETRHFDHYYRAYDESGQPIKYCKFQQLDRFISIMNLPIDEIIIDDVL